MNLRDVTMLDVDTLFRWRNDPVTLASLPHAKPISAQDHLEWVTSRISSPHFYIAEDRESVIGTARLDLRYEISITISPSYRGFGYSVPLITMVTKQADVPVFARIVPGNEASVRAFVRAGYSRDPVDLYRT